MSQNEKKIACQWDGNHFPGSVRSADCAAGKISALSAEACGPYLPIPQKLCFRILLESLDSPDLWFAPASRSCCLLVDCCLGQRKCSSASSGIISGKVSEAACDHLSEFFIRNLSAALAEKRNQLVPLTYRFSHLSYQRHCTFFKIIIFGSFKSPILGTQPTNCRLVSRKLTHVFTYREVNMCYDMRNGMTPTRTDQDHCPILIETTGSRPPLVSIGYSFF